VPYVGSVTVVAVEPIVADALPVDGVVDEKVIVSMTEYDLPLLPIVVVVYDIDPASA
jgi:hypothetical protein